MKNLEKSFVSSTFWTDRVGYAAAIKTLDLMKKNKTWIKLKNKGLMIKNIWKKHSKNIILILQFKVWMPYLHLSLIMKTI